MTTYHAGQEIEVWGANMYPWRKAKIVAHQKVNYCDCAICNCGYEVQFLDGSRGVFDEEHIRAKRSTEADHRTLLAGDSAEKDEA